MPRVKKVDHKLQASSNVGTLIGKNLELVDVTKKKKKEKEEDEHSLIRGLLEELLNV